MKSKELKIIFIVLGIVILAVLLLNIAVKQLFRYYYKNYIIPTTPVSLVGSFEDFVENGENKPAEKICAGVNDIAKHYLTDIKTFMNIKRQGFDHVRLPVNFSFFYSIEDDALIEEKMVLVDSILDLIEQTGLYTFLDLHGIWGFDVSDQKLYDQIVRMWELVAERYKDRSDMLSFEIINEPKYGEGKYNKFLRDVIKAIRKTNPTRMILCGSSDGNQPWTLKNLDLPASDENLGVVVHIYNPGDFTHQGFVWAGRKAGVKVSLSDEMYEELLWNLNETKNFIDRTGHKVFINEFGMNLVLPDQKDIERYLGTITEFCRDNEIPWTYWAYNSGDMSLFANRKWRTSILDMLFLR